MSMISISKALKYGEKDLIDKKIDSAKLDAELLLANILGFKQEKLLANPEHPISNIQYSSFKKLINKHKQGYSVATLTSCKEFYGIDFYVNKDVLIPRPETEILVENVLGLVGLVGVVGFIGKITCPTDPNDPTYPTNLNILEIGTGSGCVALTLAKYMPKAKILALDVSKKALKVAKKNKRRLKIENVKFKKSDLLSEFKNSRYRRWVFEPDIIIANLPYLTKKELKEPSISKEPKLALYGGKEGLELYEKLLKEIKQIYKKENRNIVIFLEINPSQSKKITELIKNNLPKAKIELKKDLAQKDRVVKIEI